MIGAGIGLTAVAVRGAGGASLAQQYAALIGGATGFWCDARVTDGLWQDAAGTVPVTSDGDPVGRIECSGSNVALVQATAASRPLWREGGGMPYLEFGGDDFLVGSCPGVSAGGFAALAWNQVDQDSLRAMFSISADDWNDSAIEFGLHGGTDNERIRISGSGNASLLSVTKPFDGLPSIGWADLTSGAIEAAVDEVTGTASDVWPDAPLTTVALGGRTNGAFVGHGQIYAAFWAARTLSSSEQGRVISLVTLNRAGFTGG